MSVLVVTARPEHAAELAAAMRPADEAECLAAGYTSALEALETGLANSEAWAIHFDGELGAVIGVDEQRPGLAFLWCLTSAVVERKKLSFWRASKRIVEHLRRHFSLLVCSADARHERALAWLERLDFRVLAAEPNEKTGMPFHLATIGGL